MTHILHRHLRTRLPRAVGGRGIVIVDADGKEYLDASGGAAVSCLGHGHPDVLRRDACADRSPCVCPHELLHHRSRRVAGRSPDRACARGHVARLSRVRRLGGHRGGAQDGPAVFRRDRRAAAAAFHRPPTELPRQHAGRARGRRQRVAAAPVRAAADRRDARLAVLRIPRPPPRRIARSVRRAARARARGRDRKARAAQRHRLRRRARRGRDAGRGDRRCPATSAASARSAIATASC